MFIGIDYDETWTADPALWAEFARNAIARGHTVAIVTWRRTPPDEPLPVPVYCTGGRAKRWYLLENHGISVDIAIDDFPEAWDKDL